MDNNALKQAVVKSVVKTLAAQREYFVPAAVSNRHVHLSQEALDVLFGKGYQLKVFKMLSQPGQYACEEKVTLVGKKGEIKEIRVLGPVRPDTQVEISLTDSFALGIPPVVKMSGDVKSTPGGKLIGPKGEYDLAQGVIVAKRHIHMSPEQAAWFGLKNGDVVSVRKNGERPIVLEGIAVRSGDSHDLELHIDMDEANAGVIKNGDLLELLK